MMRYIDFYYTELGKKILEEESSYIQQYIKGSSMVLSIGCGPGAIEKRICEIDPQLRIICADNSIDMLSESIIKDKVLCDGSRLCFKNSVFDSIIYITSLEFIKNYRDAIKEGVRVLRKKGKLIALLLNQKSKYFKERYSNGYYIRKNLKQFNTQKIEEYISMNFSTKREYFLGIDGYNIFQTNDPELASLYVIKGVKEVDL